MPLPGKRFENGMSGRELAEHLAQQLRAQNMIAWTNSPLGSVTRGSRAFPTPLADVFSMQKAYENFQATVYEVKVDRGDFLRDANGGKYRRYLPHCNRLYFATPAGLVAKEEVPEECGLTTLGPHGWRVVKMAPQRVWNPDPMLLLSLIFRGYQEIKTGRDLGDRERWVRNASLQELAREHGIKIGYQIAEADDLMRRARETAATIGECLGKDYTGNLQRALWDLKYDVEKLLGQRKILPQALDLAAVLRKMFEGNDCLWDLERIVSQLQAKKE